VAPLDIPPRLGELERRLTLAQLVAAWAKARCSAPLVVGGPASTLALAGDLARLMDDMVTRGVDWKRSTGWCRTSSTNIGSTRWNSCASRARRGRSISRKSADRTGGAARSPDRGGSRAPDRASRRSGDRRGLDRLDAGDRKIPARVAKLPQGAVVLPGLDTDLDDEAWQLIGGVRTRKANSPRRRPRTIRNSRCMRCWIASASSAATSKFWARRRRMDATCWCPRRCGHRTRPRNGTAAGAAGYRRERFRGGMKISP
jgi:hypothetical protein